MFDIESFPRAEEVNSENLASAIFECEIYTIFWTITEAVRKEKNDYMPQSIYQKKKKDKQNLGACEIS